MNGTIISPDPILARLTRESLSTSWLAQRRGQQPAQVNRMRRDGELLGVRPPGRQDYLYPAWQFDEQGEPLPIIPRIVRAARRAKISEMRLYELMSMRLGLGNDRRLSDRLRDGGDEYVLSVVEGR